MPSTTDGVGVTWVTAFLDLAVDAHAAGTAYWSGVTGYGVSTVRGTQGEFASLVPAGGDEHLGLQRLGAGPSRAHLDVHVADPADAAGVAETLGATVVEHVEHGYVVFTSPAGIVFCLVDHHAVRRPAPAIWPGGHRSVVDQVALDLAAADAEPEVAFWLALTGWEHRVSNDTYSSLVRPASVPLRVLFHRVGDQRSPATVHLDLATDDRPAEVARHVALGGVVRNVATNFTVLVDPAGLPYCVTDRDPDTGLLG